ncbi:MAG TPA: ABC transporter substrate-binding protein, partial [Clostridiaceae bacterium]|nr:ABC transporter substrate-binding protein [Clostridiaceae bacterium]
SIVLDWYPNAIHTFIYTAMERGFYEEEGLEIEILYPANPNDGITMPAAGRADIGMYYPHDIIIAIANENVPLKSIGAVCQDPLNVVIAPTENNIHSPDDLEGKVLGYPSHEITELFIKSMRTSEGKPLENVELQDIGFDILTAMTSGRVDATSGGMVNHEVPVLEDKGIPVTYFYPTDYGVPTYYEMVFVTGEETLAEKKSQLAAFLRASVRGFQVVKEDPEAAVDLLLKYQEADQFPLTKSVEMQSLEILIDSMEHTDRLFTSQRADMWQQAIDWLESYDMLERPLTPEDIMADISSSQ